MTALPELLNQVGTVEAVILTVLFLSMSYFFLRSGRQSSAPNAPEASSDHADATPPPRPVASTPPSPSLAPVAAPQVTLGEPGPLRPLQATPVGPATREFMELLARMGGGAADAKSAASEEHWSPPAGRRAG